MSADDQRAADAREWLAAKAGHAARERDREGAAAALAEFDRLRAELAETTVAAKTWEDKFRRVRDQLQGEADAHAATLAEQRESRDIVWWMGANLGRAYTAGDALADAVETYSTSTTIDNSQVLMDKFRAWRSVRGDARTAPAAGIAPDGEPYDDEQPTTWDELADEFEGQGVYTPGDNHYERTFRRPDLYAMGRAAANITAAARIRYLLPRLSAAPAVARTDGQPPADERSQFDECARCGHQYQNHIGLDGTRCNAGEPCSCAAFVAPADGTAAPGESIEELREELALRRSGIATAPPCTDGYWRNERHPPPPSATSGENANPREDT